MVKGKVKVVNVELDLNLEEEIRKQTAVDSRMKTRVNNIIERAQLREQKIDKKARGLRQLEEQFRPLFDAFLPGGENPIEITKDEALKILGIRRDELGSTIQKFKKFLRVVQENEWVLLISKNDKKERIYFLRRFSEPG